MPDNQIKEKIAEIVINERINYLNNIMNVVKMNRFFPYTDPYIEDFAQNIINNTAINSTNSSSEAFKQYKLKTQSIQDIKKCILTFYQSINPDLTDKVIDILNKADLSPNSNIRAYATNGIIHAGYSNKLTDLITLVHEISHCLAGYGDQESHKIEAFAEVESEMTEQLFLEYLVNQQYEFVDEKGNIRPFNQLDMNKAIYNKLNVVLNISQRTLDEQKFTKLLGDNDCIDSQLLVNYASSNDPHDILRGTNIIQKCLNHYYQADQLKSKPTNYYDLHNGQHLSNEARFIYAYMLTERFNSLYEEKDKKAAYNEYLKHADTFDIARMSQFFQISPANLADLPNDMIAKYNKINAELNGTITKSPQL